MPELEGGKEGVLESLVRATATTLVSESETQVKETDTEINKPTEEATGTLPVTEEVRSETSVPTFSVSEPVPIVDGPIAIVEEMEADESGVSAPVEPPSAVVDPVEEVLPATEPAGYIGAQPILDETSIPTQAAEEIPVGAEIVVPQTVSPYEIGGTPIVEDSPVVATEFVTEAISEEITPEISAELAADESKAPDTPVEAVVEKPEPIVDAPLQETTEDLPAESEVINHASIVEESSAVESGVEQSVAANETPIDEDSTIVEERSQERAVEPELPIEVVEQSVDAGIPETQEAATDEVPVSGGSPEEPSDAASETFATFATEDMPPVEAPLLETSLVAVEPEEVTPVEPTSEEPSDQQIISSGESFTEAVPADEVPSQEQPVFEEEIPTRLGTGETPLVEPQQSTKGHHEESAVESKLPEFSSAEPELPLEELETTLPEVAPIEVLQVADATNEAPFAKDAMLAEAAVMDVPEREGLPSEVGEAAKPTGGTLLGVPESAEEFLELSLPTSEEAHTENIPFADQLPIAEMTPPTEEEPFSEGTPATGGVTATSEELTEETPIGVGEGIGPTTETIKDSDASPENVTASVPEVSEESLRAEVAIPVAAEESVVISEAEVTSEAIAETSGLPEVVEGAPEVDEAVHTDLMKVAEPPTIGETRTKDTPPDEPVLDTEDSPAVEQPSPSILSATDAEKNPLPESPIHPEEGVSPLDDLVSVPEEEQPVIPEVTSPDAVEDDSVPVNEMPLAILVDAEQPTPIVADEALGSVEASPEVGPQPHTETAAEPLETTSATSEQPAERGDNINANPATEVSADIDQPIHSQEIEHPAVEGGIIDEPIVESSRDDLSIEKSDEQTPPDVPVASSTAETSNEYSDEERAHINIRNKPADVTANTPDPTIAGTTSISEKGPVETPSENSSPSLFDPSSVVEPDIVPGSLDELSPESGDPAPTGGHADKFPASSEHIVPIDVNEPDEVDEVPTSVEESPDVAESSGEPDTVLSEEPELASELPNGVSDSQTAIEAIGRRTFAKMQCLI